MAGEEKQYDYEYCNSFGPRNDDQGFRHIRIFNVSNGKHVAYAATEKEALEKIKELQAH